MIAPDSQRCWWKYWEIIYGIEKNLSDSDQKYKGQRYEYG